MTSILAPAVLMAFPFCLLMAAATDIRRFIIPDWTSIVLVIGFLAAFSLTGLGFQSFGWHLATGAGALALGFALFAVGAWGGGDGKLFAAAALWFDPSSVVYFAVYTMLVGGGVGLVILIGLRFQTLLAATPVLARLDFQKLARFAPYGVAIAAGGLLAFPQTDIFAALWPAVAG